MYEAIEPEISIKVFISYAHADQELRKKLEDHLSWLKHSEQIVIWQDEEIPAGANREDQINTHLNGADLILLLISPSFMASKDAWNKEAQTALERYKAGKVWVIPIILKPVIWKNTSLGELQPLPTEAKPVTRWNNPDAALEDVAQGIQKVVEQLQARRRKKLPLSTSLDYLARQMRTWFETLNYSFEQYEKWNHDCFEWIINVPHRRRYDRILIRGVDGEARIHHATEMRIAVEEHRVDEGWIVAMRRVSEAARREVEYDKVVSCYTFDELLDLDADFSQYLDYLAREIQGQKVDTTYVPLACRKEEFDPRTKEKVGTSMYNESNGWIEGYIDRWLTDPSKEHISVLGEFGTGKTWFTLHYAWITMQRYLDARERGIERPRLPLIIPLRDYAKAVSVESLFSEFFFRKYEIDLPGYSVFEQLNRMGKLLLIFDGFDEMADKVDRQKMINNFWELARTVVPGSKVILTCRTEHFPYAKEGHDLLDAKLQASTASLTGEPPQFEVLELQKLDNDQIQKLLGFHTTPDVLQKVMNNKALVDLARRPMMNDLILEALPDIEAGKPVNMSHVYLYAVQRKMERDISNERTFTSLKDKLYFLCELSWEMLSTNQMSLNYRLFPDRIRKLFGSLVEEQKDLDHWHYDMMGQTMLIRNADGDYTPAHRSLMEFFVAYKLVAEIGALDSDFIGLAQSVFFVDQTPSAKNYTWRNYFNPVRNETNEIVHSSPLRNFIAEPVEYLATTFGKQEITDLLSLLIMQMSSTNGLWEVIKSTRNHSQAEVNYVGGNAINALLGKNQSLIGADLAHTVLIGASFEFADLSGANLYKANLRATHLTDVTLINTDLSQANLTGANFWERNPVTCIAFNPANNNMAYSSHDRTIRIWDMNTGNFIATLKAHENSVLKIAFSPNGNELISVGRDKTVRVWDMRTMALIATLQVDGQEIEAVYNYDGQYILSGDDHGTVRVWDRSKFTEIYKIEGFGAVHSLACHPSDNLLAVSGSNGVEIWDLTTKQMVTPLNVGNLTKFRWSNVLFDPSGSFLLMGRHASAPVLINTATWKKEHEFMRNTSTEHKSERYYKLAFNVQGDKLATGTYSGIIPIWHATSAEELFCIRHPVKGGKVESVAFDNSGRYIATGDYDGYIQIWDSSTGMHVQTVPHARINCQGAKIRGAKGLMRKSPSKKETLSQWLRERGAILD